MRNICFNNHLKKLCQQLVLIAVVLSVSIITPAHQALAQSSRTTFDYSQNGILYYDNCGVPITSGGTDVASGVNLEFPTDLKDEDIAKAIDDYIKQAAPDSILIDTGKYIVASSRSANVSPFLTVAHAKVESALGKPGISIYVDQANNAFKRSAVEGSGEPSLPSIHKVKPYFWSSPRASVDHTAPENQTDRNNGDFPRYLRSSYNSLITDGNIEGYINEYFKSRSISSLYKDQFIQVLNDLTKLSKGEEVKPASTNSSDNICCNENNTPVNGSVNISGSTNAEKVFNYLTAKGFNAEQAAAVVGNLMQESGGGTEDLQTDVVNSIGASGMIQWLYDRKDRLMEAAKRMGKPWQDIEVQIYFMGWEVGLEGSETYGGRGPTHSQVGEMMKNASSLESATRIWLERYEIPCNPGSGCDHEMQIRLPYAKQIYEKYGDGGGSGPSSLKSGGGACGEPTNIDGDFTYYQQTDPKWQKTGLPIANSGCGPTSLAMIFATKRNKDVTPVDVASYLQNINTWSYAGLQWSGIPKAAEKWGMKSNDLGTDWEKAKSELQAGKLLMLSGAGAAPFTSGGHLIVGRGLTDDGKIIIANPAPMSDNPENTPYAIPISGIMNIWSFE